MHLTPSTPQAARTSVPLPIPDPAWTIGHEVMFYDSEGYLASAVGGFLAEGFRAGQPAIVIATESRRRAFETAARDRGITFEEAGAAEAIWLDARQTLSAFMVGLKPDPELFEATVGNVFERVLKDRRYLVVRAYGEMVDLLWKDGNVDGAIQLEQLWNGLADKYAFSLLCAYSMGNFLKEADGKAFRAICDHHGKVQPTEEYLRPYEGDRLRQIALLQQRARVLEAEVQHRRELEAALRETLATRARIEDELRRREEELRDTLENGLEPMHWVDSQGRIVWVNTAECAMLGYSRDELIGRSVAELHADQAVIADILDRLGKGEELRNFRARLRRKDGGIRTVLISSNVFRQNGRFIHTRCFTRDITDLQA